MNSELAAEHDRQYHKLLAFIAKMESVDPSWTCVVKFYASMHLITAYLVMKSNTRFDSDSGSHHERRKAIDRCPELNVAKRYYRELKDLSEAVRYVPGYIFTAKNDSDSSKRLESIRSIVEPLLKKLFGGSKR